MADLLYDDCKVKVYWTIPDDVTTWVNPRAGYSDVLNIGCEIDPGRGGEFDEDDDEANKTQEPSPDNSPIEFLWRRVGIAERATWYAIATFLPTECIIDRRQYKVSWNRPFIAMPECSREVEIHARHSLDPIAT